MSERTYTAERCRSGIAACKTLLVTSQTPVETAFLEGLMRKWESRLREIENKK